MYPDFSLPLEREENPVHDRVKRHEIRMLRRAGLTFREGTRKTGFGLRGVTRVARQGTVDPPALRPVGRPPNAFCFREAARRILSEEGSILPVEILRRLREQRVGRGKNPVYQVVRRLRPQPTPPMVRFEGHAGEFCQNEFVRLRGYNDDDPRRSFMTSIGHAFSATPSPADEQNPTTRSSAIHSTRSERREDPSTPGRY